MSNGYSYNSKVPIATNVDGCVGDTNIAHYVEMPL